MHKFWKRTAFVATASVATGLLTMLGTVTQGDVVRHHDWIDPIEVKVPRIGQYYIVADDGTIKEPLCALEDDDLRPVAYPAEGRRYVNWLGKVAPFVVDVVGFVLQPVQAATTTGEPGAISYALELERLDHHYAPAATLRGLTRRIMQQRDLDRIRKDESTASHRAALRLRDCASTIRASLASGFNVCQLDEVVHNSSKRSPLGVGFASLCLATPTDTKPRILPVLERGSFLSDLKQAMGLIEVEPLS